jgi:hypothetical protein
VLISSLGLTVAAAGAAAGFMPAPGDEGGVERATDGDSPGADDGPLRRPVVTPTPSLPQADHEPSDESAPEAKPAPEADTRSGAVRDGRRRDTARPTDHGEPSTAPPHSGHGRRVVYDMSDQRVWLVGAHDSVRRSYLVSGSVYDNLGPGSYEVYSRSRHAVSFDQLSTMDYMVRFTEGDNAAIGFHDIPTDLAGDPVQSFDQLGTPRSHGCIRQRPADAKAMWRFAGIGTTVRVLA